MNIDEEIMHRLKELDIDCPECDHMEDEQYYCTTCGCEGGHGIINVYDYFEELYKVKRKPVQRDENAS